MIIKVCGMRETENIREVAELGIDMMGFIFWPESPRFVKMISARAGIIPDYSEERLRKMRQGQESSSVVASRPKRVGVFVDEMPQSIVTRVYNYDLNYVQLHGNESAVMIENLKRTLIPDIAPDIKIIKALSIREKDDVKRWREYEGTADMLLFDTKCKTVGGSGEQFDWSVLEAYDGNIPFLLSGGIGPDDAERVLKFNHPQFAGIDLNSRFEISPALKNVDELKSFIQTIRQHEQNQ
ncbi:MAG: phosphoribosylanthranilate isomerase [Prevotella sp.]|nr:phosphoribosylanthranilate isomerase [Prevotella sp.]